MNRARSTLSALAIVATIAGASVAAVASTVALIDVRSTPPAPSPDVLSIRLQDEDTAHDMWDEARSMGESVCLTELNDGGLRYWLHSCASPRFTDGGTGQRSEEHTSELQSLMGLSYAV